LAVSQPQTFCCTLVINLFDSLRHSFVYCIHTYTYLLHRFRFNPPAYQVNCTLHHQYCISNNSSSCICQCRESIQGLGVRSSTKG
jgi:hypothetical protein